ncbi:hypothetical protein ACJ72_00321 [Emergomyces africanus]|uniref:Uncharacterized protein n=1 Tax=Emergomyces africanus TaxID=1955775 RepID=A0A1B7P8F6_9EURO|nr:hypothetical protein ACJ72_00321 [Emergomyces africanus]
MAYIVLLPVTLKDTCKLAQPQQACPQPDLPLLLNATQTVVGQLALLPSIPALTIHNQLDEVMNLLRGIDGRMDRLEVRMDRLGVNTKANNRNSIARSVNSTINRDTIALVRLTDQRDEEINGFSK